METSTLKHARYCLCVNPLSIVIGVVLILLIGSCQGSGLSQAGSLMGLLKARRLQRTVTDGQKWVTPTPTPKPTSVLVGSEKSMSNYAGRDKEDDLIVHGLPEQPLNVKFKQYAGYITVDEHKQRSLFYYFTESAHNPSADPLLLWLNGGPGCSSLGYGAMLEIGPFGVKSDGKTLYQRQDSWNKVANTLFLESPAGVGFSYSNSTSDYNDSGDKRTVEDSYAFLVNWLRRFPEYKNRDFYIAGESYAGFYIPELADVIIQENMRLQDPAKRIKLKGIMIGNGIMNPQTDTQGSYDYFWTHALISDETHQGLMNHCVASSSSTTKCSDFENRAAREVGNIDFYNIYAPLCSNVSRSNSLSKSQFEGPDPCADDYIYAYLNLPQVQQALHANTTRLPYSWSSCSLVLTTWNDRPDSMVPIYKKLMANGLRILLFSGDIDSVIPVTSTPYSVNALNLSVKNPWQPWIDHQGEVGGYRIEYRGLALATVRGAGHEVPRYQPGRALTLLMYFLKN